MRRGARVHSLGFNKVFHGDGYDGYIKAWHFEGLAALAPMAPPRGVVVKAKRVSLAGEWDMSRHSGMREDWPFDFDVLDGGASQTDTWYDWAGASKAQAICV